METNEKDLLKEQNNRDAVRVSTVSIVVNLLLSLLKFLAGILAHSSAMISDSIHSASDVFSTIIVMIGISISSKESDEDHPYGHERLECVSSVVLASVLMATGIGIGLNGVKKISSGNIDDILIPGTLALIAAVVSIGVKEWMYWYTRAVAKKISSTSLMADAWHHRSDALSSVGALVGIAGARMGFPILDPLASILICFFIAKAAIDIFKDAMEKMVDKSCPEETVEEIKAVILKQPKVEGVDEIKTRLFGSRYYVDVEILMDGSMTLFEAHEVAEKVHDEIEKSFPKVKHCMVHVNPKENQI